MMRAQPCSCSISIQSVMVSQADGIQLKSLLGISPVNVSVFTAAIPKCENYHIFNPTTQMRPDEHLDTTVQITLLASLPLALLLMAE
jgi:hypothetical protein